MFYLCYVKIPYRNQPVRRNLSEKRMGVPYYLKGPEAGAGAPDDSNEDPGEEITTDRLMVLFRSL